MATEETLNAWRYWRRRGLSVRRAIELVRQDRAEGVKRYGRGRPALNPRNDKGEAWAEYPEELGFRFMGFADEISKRAGSRRVDHQGWFLDSDVQDESARGAVYLLPPAPDGRTRYVPALRTGSERTRGGAWQDMSGEDSALLFLADIELGEAGGAGSYNEIEAAALDCAGYADSRAERYAEAERDYQEAWRAGQEYAEALDSCRDARRRFLALRRDIKGMSPDSRAARTPAICEALRIRAAELAERWQATKARAAEIWAERPTQPWQAELLAAWDDGAGA